MNARAEPSSSESVGDQYKVRIQSWVGHVLGRLDEEERTWFVRAFEALRDDPRPTHAVWAGTGQYRLSFGGHWVRYAVDDSARAVVLVEMGRRPQR